jgi:tRNA-specific adenosine deaminase 3
MIKNPAQEAAQMTRFMKETITLSIQNQKSNPQGLPITALLVNPKTSEILSIAHDTRLTTHHPLNHPIMLLLNQLPSLLPQNTTVPPPDDNALLDTSEEEQYYAQLYDVYTTHEPCTMCCMALVHSRIRRLIFWREMKTGAREVAWMKGDEMEGGLNHRFMCFEGIPGGLGGDIEVAELADEIFA